MVFLFTVAWEAWPTAVLVMSFVAGILVSLQYLVFGVHRFVNMVLWTARSVWRALLSLGRRPQTPPPAAPSPPEVQMRQVDQSPE